MIDIKKLQAIQYIITHDNCSDGLASAMIIKDVCPGATVIFASYNSAVHRDLIATPGMIFCDFSPHPDKVQDFVKAGAIVLDHHKFQKDLVAAFGDLGVFADEVDKPGVSGAVLAYNEVWLPLVKANPITHLKSSHRAAYDQTSLALAQTQNRLSNEILLARGSKPPPEELDAHPDVERLRKLLDHIIFEGVNRRTVEHFAKLIGIRDTWQTGSDLWAEARATHSSLLFFPRQLWLTSPIFPNPVYDSTWNFRMGIGRYLVDRQDQKVTKILGESYRGTVNGLRVLIHEGVSNISDVAERARSSFDICLAFSYHVEREEDVKDWPTSSPGPKIIVSCRSGGSFDVGKFAKAHGGGGHTKASGFTFHVKPEDPNPYTYLLNLVQAYK